MMRKVACILALFALAALGASVVMKPSLPNSFTTRVIMTVGNYAQEYLAYADREAQSVLYVGRNEYGTHIRSLERHDLRRTFVYTCDNSECTVGSCNTSVIGAPLTAVKLPPYAFFVKNTTVGNLKNVQIWRANNPDVGNITWSIFVDPIKGFKNIQLVELLLASGVPPFIQYVGAEFSQWSGPMDFDEDNSMFDVPEFCGDVPPPQTRFVLSGYVSDASTGLPIQGAIVEVSLAGVRAVTGADGLYTIYNVPPDTYSVYAKVPSSPGKRYNLLRRTIPVFSDIPSGTMADFALTSLIRVGWRIAVTWNEFPADLDSRLWTSWGCLVYYRYPTCNRPFQGNIAKLNRDVTAGYGPEVIDVSMKSPKGEHLHFVSVYSTRAGSIGFQGSGATAILYDRTGEVDRMTLDEVPIEKTGYRFWVTWKLNAASHTMTRVNSIQAEEPPAPV